MKSFKKVAALLLVVSMFSSLLAVEAGATTISPMDATSSTEVKLTTTSTTQTITWPVASGYGYWKIAITNTSTADLTVRILKGSPSGTAVFSDRVNANSTLSFYAEDGSPLAAGAYYIIVQSAKSDVNLKGTLWYKFGSSHADINN